MTGRQPGEVVDRHEVLLRDAIRHGWIAAGTASLLGAVPASACAQAPVAPTATRIEAVIDVGAAHVDYDEFLPSSMVSVGGLLRVDGARAGLALRGSVGRYGDTGNLNTQVGAALGAYTGQWRGLRGEVGAVAAAGRHETVGGSGTGQLLARLHAGGGLAGGWAGGGVGWTAAGGGYLAVARGEVGAWLREGPLRASFAVAPTRAGGLAYGDVTADVQWTRGRLELGGLAGLRVGDEVPSGTLAPRTRTWASADAIVWVARRLAVTATAGHAPSDPAAGTGGGRYLSLGVRLAAGASRAAEPPRVLLPRATLAAAARGALPDSGGAPRDSAADGGTGRETLAVVELGDGALRLELDLPGARSAELMGDVTDWQPIPLRRRPDGHWETTLTLAPGVHRLNLRTDGGPWRVPPLLTAVDDGFGGQVGLLVVRR